MYLTATKLLRNILTTNNSFRTHHHKLHIDQIHNAHQHISYIFKYFASISGRPTHIQFILFDMIHQIVSFRFSIFYCIFFINGNSHSTATILNYKFEIRTSLYWTCLIIYYCKFSHSAIESISPIDDRISTIFIIMHWMEWHCLSKF